MKKLMHLLPLAAAFVFAMFAFAGSAHAQATRTWVSGVGDDANPCSRTAPCKTFAGAISKTAIHGEINCIDPGGFGAVTIVKSITIDCHEVFASIANTGTNGIIINFGSFPVTDLRQQVRIRNISFLGADTGLNGIRILGTASPESEVFIEDVVIDGNFGGTARGVSDERSGGGELTILNTTIRNMGGTGVTVAAVGAGQTLNALLDNVRILNATNGIAISTNVKLMLNDVALSGNSGSGIVVGAGAEANLDNCVVNDNGTGVQNSGTVRLSNTDIAFNATAILGTTSSFGNSRISGNTSGGTAPALITPTGTIPAGQQ